jgi:hypothetical protein
MRSNLLITACRDGIFLFPAIENEQNTFWNMAITVPEYEGDLLKRLYTARDYKQSIMQHYNSCFSEWRTPFQYLSLIIHDSYGSDPL